MNLIEQKYLEKQTARKRRVAKRAAERAVEDAEERAMEQSEQLEKKQEALTAQLAIIESLSEHKSSVFSNSQGSSDTKAYLDSDNVPSECVPKQTRSVHRPVKSVDINFIKQATQ